MKTKRLTVYLRMSTIEQVKVKAVVKHKTVSEVMEEAAQLWLVSTVPEREREEA